MTLSAKPSARSTLATVGMQWLVLIVIALGMIVSSIGMTSSHGLAVIAASHESALPSSEDPHGHMHSDHGTPFVAADDSSSADSSAEHPHHGMDHSHDIAHYLPLAWGAVSPQLPSWEVVVRSWIDMGQAYQLDRPPMG